METPDCTLETVDYNGVRIALRPGILEPRIKAAIDEGWYEFEESRNLPYLLQDGERVLELGTGLGFITTLMALDARVESVLSFEANPELVELARRTTELNGVAGKVSIENALAMPEPASAAEDFYLRDEFWASSLQGKPWGYREVISVATRDINTIIAEFRPTLLVVDIEGGERFFFDRLRFGSLRKIFLELHQDAIGRQGMHHIFRILGENGFHYDQWHSEKSVVLFSHVDRDKPLPAAPG